MVLDLADQTDGHALSQDRFRRLVYFRADGQGTTWTPGEQVAPAALEWRLYQAREYYNYALTRLLAALHRWGLGVTGGGLRSLALSEVHDHVRRTLTSAGLASHLGVSDPGYDADAPLVEFAAWVSELAEVGPDLDEAWTFSAPLHEHRLYELAGSLPREADEAFPVALALLCLLAARFGSPTTELRWNEHWWVMREGGIKRLSMHRFFVQLRQRQAAGATLGDLAHWLLEHYVVRQHVRVAVPKLPDDTFRFQLEGGRMRFIEQALVVEMKSSRFAALAATVHELGLVGDLLDDSHPLTDAGRELLTNDAMSERPVTTISEEPAAEAAP